MFRYSATILLGAFLLFQVQPQIARSILPWFGGGTAVWSTCMLFFQVLLLGGYAYAHWLSRALRPVHQAMLHGTLLLASLAFMPVVPAAGWKPTGEEEPILHILLLLTATVGLPYLLLAATGPLLQSWFAREFHGRSPYRLYALSNVGSLAALLSFPFVFEPNLTIALQADVWAILYVIFALLCGVSAIANARRADSVQELADAVKPNSAATSGNPDATPGEPIAPAAGFGSDRGPATATAAREAGDVAPAMAMAEAEPGAPATTLAAPEVATSIPVEYASSAAAVVVAPPTEESVPTAGQRWAWLGLAMLPSLMLLGVTNMICQDIASVPFLWVMPLSIYLVTFILTFESSRWYRPAIMAPLLIGVSLFILCSLGSSFFIHSAMPQVLGYCGALFLCGMVCHGELVRRKPAPSRLTGFYLLISAGGALGGSFVAVVAPNVFDSYREIEIGLIGCLLVALIALWSRKTLRYVLVPVCIVGSAIGIWVRTDAGLAHLEQSRNFYGRLTVDLYQDFIEVNGQTVPRRVLTLGHGSTMHGRQVQGAKTSPHDGMSYYSPGTAPHFILAHFLPDAAKRSLRVGIIGLGAGSLAHYARPGDHYVFYEIDPNVVRVADSMFTYLGDARRRGVKVDVRLGDARITMEREFERQEPQKFDVFVVDAFSSDSIPIHLLTKECNKVYRQHLAEGAIMLFHISNRHLNLMPVIRGLAQDNKMEVRFVTSHIKDIAGPLTMRWAIMTANPELLSHPNMQAPPPKPGAAPKSSLLWTDDFSSLWHVLGK